MKKFVLPSISLLILAVLSGCATPSVAYTESKKSTVQPATPERVKTCEYLDDIIGTSGWYGVFATQGVENARAETMTKAANMGATHIVWQSNAVNYGSTSVAGKVYRCTD